MLKKLNKCEHCVQLSHSCNLTISSVKLNCISEEICCLQKEKKKTEKMKRKLKMKRERLYKQITLLIKCQSSLIDTELHNIKELEVEKCT